MRFRLVLVLLAVLVWGFPVEAHAKRRVEWTQVEVRKGDDAKRVAKRFKSMLKRRTRQAKWGKGDTLKLSATVTRLDWEERGDVLRVTVTVVARIAGGKSARSHIRVGGRPKERRKLEGEALGIVSSGLITRLADMSRQ